MTQGVPALPPADSTRDGDLGVTPELLSEGPRLDERMAELGYETSRNERPGVWSPISHWDRDIHTRDSVDLIAPMSLARGNLTSHRDIRSARVGAHGKCAVSATSGTELSIVDRQLYTLRAFDGGSTVNAYVAGPSALLCAKAYKVQDRLDPAELRRNSERLRPKDFADLYRLLLAIAPEEAAETFAQGAVDARIGEAVSVGRRYLTDILNDSAYLASMVAEAWGDPSSEGEFRADIEGWSSRFNKA